MFCSKVATIQFRFYAVRKNLVDKNENIFAMMCMNKSWNVLCKSGAAKGMILYLVHQIISLNCQALTHTR